MSSIEKSHFSYLTNGAFKQKDIREFKRRHHFDEVVVRDQKLITVKIAKDLNAIKSIKKLEIWSGVTRAAMRYIISIPNLEELVIFDIKYPGKLSGFETAANLQGFRSLFDLSEPDFLEISKVPNLRALSAQDSSITVKAVESILTMPFLTELDLESSNFDDEMARLISQSKTITHLEVGSSRLSARGLNHICGMEQLTMLDIWLTDITEADLDMLSELPNLEYLSIGGHDEQTVLTAAGVLPRLAKIKCLNRIWLDGIPLTDDEKTRLEARYEYVRN